MRLLIKPNARQFHLALADKASGTPLQWWHLEIAARLPTSPTTHAMRCLLWFVAHFNIGYTVPFLWLLKLNGLNPYLLDYHPPLARRAREASLVGVCLLGGLIGLTSLNATRELLLTLIALLGGGALACLTWLDANRHRIAIHQRQAESVMSTIPPESVLGMVGYLCAVDVDPTVAPSMATRIATNPDAINIATLNELGLTSPIKASVWHAALKTALAWIGGIVSMAWPCWLTPTSWQFAPALLGLALVHFVSSEPNKPWWPLATIHGLTGIACLFAGLLIHRY